MKTKSKKDTSEVNTSNLADVVDSTLHDDLKEIAKLITKVSKRHQTAKDTLSETQNHFALLKAIYKHEKKTLSRPEQIYIDNIKKRLDENLNVLLNIYD